MKEMARVVNFLAYSWTCTGVTCLDWREFTFWRTIELGYFLGWTLQAPWHSSSERLDISSIQGTIKKVIHDMDICFGVRGSLFRSNSLPGKWCPMLISRLHLSSTCCIICSATSSGLPMSCCLTNQRWSTRVDISEMESPIATQNCTSVDFTWS